jgi:DNA-binding NtrC family response regulator
MSPAKLRCIVIDHDPDFLEKARRWFVTSCTDFEVLPFSSSLDAVEFLREKRVDLILTAYLMPQIDGLQLISIARGLHPRVPIVMTSGVPICAAALARGATAFFAKGSIWLHLDATLARLRRHLSPAAA